MEQDGVKPGIAEDDFEHAFSGRILPENGVDLFAYGAEHVA